MLLRGIRSGLDYEYERSLADINRCLTGIETVFLFTAQHLSHVSSGAIRELIPALSSSLFFALLICNSLPYFFSFLGWFWR